MRIEPRLYEFDSLEEMLTFADSPRPGRDERASQRREHNGEFTGARDWTSALKLARGGWTEGAEKIENISAKIATSLSSFRPETRMREVGPGTINMGRYIQGHPQPYAVRVNSHRQGGKSRHGKIVRIALNIAVSGGIETDVLIARGAAVAALVRCLEQADYRVQVTIVAANRGGWLQDDKKPLDTRCVIKRADQKMSFPVLAFTLAHPSMFRRVIFSVWEHAPESIRTEYGFSLGGGYGLVGDDEEIRSQSDLYLEGAEYGDENFISPEYARTWVIDRLRDQGVTVRTSE